MDNKRDRLLEQKRQDLDAALQTWAADNRILSEGEHLTFELRISRVTPMMERALKESATVNRRALLPPDEEYGWGGRAIWRLTDGDWDKLSKLPLDEQQTAFLTLLRSHKNSPLHTAVITANGIRWDRGFVRRFNTVLHGASDYWPGRVGGAYYRLKQLSSKSGYYAIMKFQSCPAETS